MKIGKVSDNVLKRSVLRQIHTKRDEVVNGAGIGEDCAVFAFSHTDKDRVVCCIQEAAVAAEADMGLSRVQGQACVIPMGHLLQRCANNLAADGAVPVAAMLAILLPQTAEEQEIRKLMQEAEKACAGLSMQIAGGQTRLTPAVKQPYAVVTAYGLAQQQNCRTAKAAKPGQDIVVSKWIGLEGTALLTQENREVLLSRYPAYLVEEAARFDRYLSVVPEAATAVKSGVCAMHDASEGGIFAALWELAEGAGVGLTIDLKKLPLRQETVEICEYLGVNPYELMSGGCLVMTAEDGQGLAAALKAVHIPAVVVGRITQSNDRILQNDGEIRYLDRPKTDEVYKRTR